MFEGDRVGCCYPDEAVPLVFGHSIHFLTRARQRLSPAREALALALYYDAPRVRRMLAALRLDAEVDRVALSLADDDTGPWVVVTREGTFVTCLSVGMSVGQRVVVERARWEEVFERLGRAQRAAAEHEETTRLDEDLVSELLEGLVASGPYVTRAQWDTFEDWLPVLGGAYAGLCVRFMEAWPHHADTFRTRAVRRTLRKAPHRLQAELRAYGQATWGLFHSALLVALDARVWMSEEQVGETAELMLRLVWVGLRLGEVRAVVLAVWAVSRLGPVALERCMVRLRAAQSEQEWMAMWVALFGLGCAHPALQDTALVGLCTPPRCTEGSPWWERWKVSTASIVPLLERSTSSDEVRRSICDAMDTVLAGADGGVRRDAGRYLGSKDAMFWVMVAQEDPRRSGPSWVLLAWLVAWSVKSEARDLFLCETAAKAWDGDGVMEWVFRDAHDDRVNASQQAASKVPRNAPCPCGSGSKFKVCCGRSKG